MLQVALGLGRLGFRYAGKSDWTELNMESLNCFWGSGAGLGPRLVASRNNPANQSGQKPNSDVPKGPLKFQ